MTAVALAAVMALVATRHPLQVTGGLLAAILLVVILRWPQVALVALLALVPFHLFFYDLLVHRANVTPQPFTYWKDVIVAGLMLGGLVANWRRDRRLLPAGNGDRLLLGMALAYAVLAAASPDPTVAGYALALDVEGPLLLVAIVLLRPERRLVVASLAAIVATATILAALAIAEQSMKDALPHFFGVDPASNVDFHTQGGGYRSGSLMGDPLILAFFLTAALPVVCAAAVWLRRPWRMVALLAFAVCLVGVVVTYTRSAYLGAMGGVIVCLAAAIPRRRLRAVLIGSFLVAAVGVAAVAAMSGDNRLLHLEDNQVHADRLSRDIDLLAARPQGYGLGRFDYVGRRFETQEAMQTSATESLYLSRALETGVGGLALFLAALTSVGVRVVRARRHALATGDRGAALIAAAGLGSLVGIALAGLNLPVQFLAIDAVMWGTCGLAISAAAGPSTTQAR